MTAEFKNTIGQQRIKSQIIRALQNERQGHAYLFLGEGGVGKFSLALEFAQMYLCKSENKPCGECENCKSIKKYSHRNFQYIFPLKLDEKQRKIDDFTQDGWEYIYQKTRERIEEPYSLITDYSAPIYVNRIRDANDMIFGRRGEKTVTIIEGIDTLSDISLNTMLKTIEEPPVGALIILLARYSVIPTIRSRCIVYRFSAPKSDEIKTWLKIKASEKSDEEISYIAEISQNLPGAALIKLSENGKEIQKLTDTFAKIVFCEKTDFSRMINLEKFIRENLERNFDLAQQILVYFISQIRIGFLCAANYSQIKPEIHIPNFKNWQQASLCSQAVDDSMLSIKKSSPLLMVLADLTIKLMEIFDERKI
ncbi:MAG: hypothetical protein LBH98_03535 [Chitinispirillales bacterium]|nr:hypothetical protein [Chitinispirillales bacterium]